MSKHKPGLEVLFRRIRTWQKMFEPNIHGAVIHLMKEAVEVGEHFFEDVTLTWGKKKENFNAEEVGEELADNFHLTVRVSSLMGRELSDDVEKKFDKNLKRKFLPPDEDGCIHHVAGSGD